MKHTRAIPLLEIIPTVPSEEVYKYKLVREGDNLTKNSCEVSWFEWGVDGLFESVHDTPAIGRSLVMSPFNAFFTWQTTPITEIVEQKEKYLKFKTENSVYKLFEV